MREYPKGAIRSINELLEYAGKPIWKASLIHSQRVIDDTYSRYEFTGRIGTKHFKDGHLYHWYEYKCANEAIMRHPLTASLLDANVIENNYNDWFMFPNHEDAVAYLAGPPCNT